MWGRMPSPGKRSIIFCHFLLKFDRQFQTFRIFELIYFLEFINLILEYWLRWEMTKRAWWIMLWILHANTRKRIIWDLVNAHWETLPLIIYNSIGYKILDYNTVNHQECWHQRVLTNIKSVDKCSRVLTLFRVSEIENFIFFCILLQELVPNPPRT